MENEPEILQKLNELLERTASNDALLRILVRQKMGNKQEKLYDQLQILGRMDVGQAMDFLGVTRPHALTLLKKLSSMPGVSYRKGNSKTNSPTTCLWDQSKVLEDQFKVLDTWILKQGEFRIGDVVTHFAILFEDARKIVLDFQQVRKNITVEGFLVRRVEE